MPFVNGKFYMNPAYGQAAERARAAHAASDHAAANPQDQDAHWVTIGGKHVLIQEMQPGQAQHGTQKLTKKSENAILESSLTAEQAVAFEDAVADAGKKYGINPNILVGIAVKESSLRPGYETNLGGSAAGLMGLTDRVQNAYGLNNQVAMGSSPTAITCQVYVAASYLRDLMHDPVPSSHPSHQLEIALGYYRSNRHDVNRAIASKGGYNAMLKLRYQNEALGSYIKTVESYQ